MSDSMPHHWLDKWERREMPAFALIPFAMLGFTALITVLIRRSDGQAWRADLALFGAALAWLIAGTVLTRRWQSRPGVTAVFFAGLIALMTVLVLRDPWSGFFTFTGYFFAWRLSSPRWRVVGVMAVAALTGSSQAGGFAVAGSSTTGAVVFSGCVLVNLVISGAFMWFAWIGHLQGERRAKLVEELSEANQRLEATLAENVGLHNQLLAQAREAGILDERQRMAREIHDTLAQGLTGIITQLQAAEQSSHDPAARRRHFNSAVRLARDSLTEARRSVDELRPEPLERAPRFADALTSVAEKWSAMHGVPVVNSATGTARPLPPPTEVVLLRAAQEALANVAKHAAATRVWLTLSYMDSEVALDVRDDGRGFEPAAVEPGSVSDGGFGLLAMRQRVEGLSGTLQVESDPGAGTVISVCVPAPGNAAGRRVA
jgi:signal transduction histidine kinase